MERNVILRSLIHLVGMSIPPLVVFFGRVAVLSVILILAAIHLLSEVARPAGKRLPLLGFIVSSVRKDAGYEMAPIFFGVGVSISLLLFEANIAFAAILVISLGDVSAKLGGAQFGRHHIPFNKKKTIEGTLFGFAFALLGAQFFVPFVIALVGAGVGMLVEVLPIRIDDNLSVPVSAGASMAAFQILVSL